MYYTQVEYAYLVTLPPALPIISSSLMAILCFLLHSKPFLPHHLFSPSLGFLCSFSGFIHTYTRVCVCVDVFKD